MLQDVKFGIKLLWKEKAFAVTALLTLALCIGANTAIFTALNAIVLNPLPFPEPSRLVTLYNIYPGAGIADRGSNGVPDYLDRKKLTSVFEEVGLFGQAGYDVGAEGSPQRIEGIYATPDFFRVLRAQPALGRAFSDDDAVLGKDNVAILSDGLWKDLYGRDPKIIGREIRLSGIKRRIVGVMPPNFGGDIWRETRIWLPFAFRPDQTSDEARHSNSWDMIARLRPGVTMTQAQQRIDALNKANLDRFPAYRELIVAARFATRILGMKDEMVRDIKPTLYLLQAAVAFVLLIGCVNVANLMLVRSNIRMKELAVRFSLGAGRLRLARQLLTESLLVAVAGGAVGVGVGVGGVRLLSRLGASELPRGADLRIDLAALAFTAMVAIVTGIAFGMVPVIHLFRHNLNDVFRQTERSGTAQRRAVWTRSALVVVQVSLAFVLLAGSGLLVLSFARLLAVDPGFKPESVLTAEFDLPRTRYEKDAAAAAFIDRLLTGLRAIPGVTSAGATTYLPFGGHDNASGILIDGYPLAPGEMPPVPGWSRVDSGYFKTMGIPVLRGRTFEESDVPGALQVCVIDSVLAKKYWPNSNPIGAKIRDGVDMKDTSLWTIVGVVPTVKVSDLGERRALGQLYFHYKQKVPRGMQIVIKGAAAGTALTSAVRQTLARLDPELPLFGNMLMTERVTRSLGSRKAPMIVCAVFAGLALLLSAVGIYGVLAYAVTQRTREFGIRVALGASVRDVLGMVAGQGLRLSIAGLLIGAAAAFTLTRLMTTLLYEVKPADPVVFVAAAAGLAAVSVIASLIPSIRALRIQPASALRYE